MTKSKLVVKTTKCPANLSIHFTSRELSHISGLWYLIFIARYHSDRHYWHVLRTLEKGKWHIGVGFLLLQLRHWGKHTAIWDEYSRIWASCHFHQNKQNWGGVDSTAFAFEHFSGLSVAKWREKCLTEQCIYAIWYLNGKQVHRWKFFLCRQGGLHVSCFIWKLSWRWGTQSLCVSHHVVKYECLCWGIKLASQWTLKK